jgi:hypothetical protein
MILEAIVTTLDAADRLNIAPMGPQVEPDLRRFILRPYKTSTTYRNLKVHGEGVLHVTDDVLLLARGAIGRVDDAPTRPATTVRGAILTGACRYHEFRVSRLDDSQDRTQIEAETVASGTLREFFGFNRAKHAVIEAAILATRTEFLPLDEILSDFRRLAVPVRKTGGEAEFAAFRLLDDHIRALARAQGLDPPPSLP